MAGTDRHRKSRLFVATLRHSRARLPRVAWKPGQQVRADLLEQAVRHLGACPQYVEQDFVALTRVRRRG